MKKRFALLLVLCVILAALPMTAMAAGSPPYTMHRSVVSYYDTYTIDNQTIEAYMTDGAGYLTKSGSDRTLVFTANDYDSSYTFSHWETYYYGALEKSHNYSWSGGDKWCFSKPGNIAEAYDRTDRSIQVNNELTATGIYYLVAVYDVKVSLTVKHNGVPVENADTQITLGCEYGNADFYHKSGRVYAHEAYCCTKGTLSVGTQFDPATEVLDSYTINGIASANYYTDAVFHDYMWFSATQDRPLTIGIAFRYKMQNVAFNANTGTGTMAAQTFDSSVEEALSANAFTKAGYRFSGWNTKADGSGTAYTDGQKVTFLPENDGDTITLYAQWSPIVDSPVVSAITYGQKLSAAAFADARWSWADDNITPKVNNSGYLAYYTPTDTSGNWSSVEGWNATLGKVERIVPVTVNQKVLTVTWEETNQFVYTGAEIFPNFTVSGILTGDDVQFTRLGGATNVRHEYMALLSEITGADGANYTFATTPTKEYAIIPADQAAPTGLAAEAETISKKADGIITGVTANMEYRKEGETVYEGVNSSNLENLAAGDYYVRYAADHNHNPSPDTMVTVAPGRKLTITVPDPQVGYTLTSTAYEVDYLGEATLTFALQEGYGKAEDFAIALNGNADSQWVDGTLPLSGIYTDIYITVTGVMDIMPPTLDGIEDGKTYYGDLWITIPESQKDDIKSVTLDGEPMGFAEGVKGRIKADNKQHTVVVEDYAGNRTVYTITVMKQIVSPGTESEAEAETPQTGDGFPVAAIYTALFVSIAALILLLFYKKKYT